MNWLWNCAFIDSFWDLPIVQIEKLLKYGQKFRLEQLHDEEKPVSTLVAITANKGGVKGRPVKSSDAYQFKVPDADLDIDPDIPEIIFSQTSQGKDHFPGWALHPDVFPLERLSIMKRSPLISKYDIRFWYSEQLLIAGAQIEEEWLYCKYAQINQFAGFIEVQEGLTIYVPVGLMGGLVVHYRFWRVKDM